MKPSWKFKDRIGDCEREQDFGPQFVEFARSIYRTNDRRADLKRQLNALAVEAQSRVTMDGTLVHSRG